MTTTPTSQHQNPKARVFISYARKDGHDFADTLRTRLEGVGITALQDRIFEEGGRDWWQQITEAIDSAEFMVMVMTPRALASDVTRKAIQGEFTGAKLYFRSGFITFIDNDLSHCEGYVQQQQDHRRR